LPETMTTSSSGVTTAVTKREDGPAGPPVYTRWWLWGGAAAVFALAGTYFGLEVRSDRDAHAALLADSANHRYQEAYDVEQSMRRNALFANISFSAAGAAAIAAIYFAATASKRSETSVVTP